MIEDANDAFFIGAYRMSSKYQNLFKLKQEYVLKMDKGSLSFISTNYHKESLLKSFDIIDPDQTFDPNSEISIKRAIKRHLNISENKTKVLDPQSFLKKILK